MIELALLAVCCGPPLAAAAIFIGIFLQGILDYFEKGRKKKKRAKAAEKQKAEQEQVTMLIRWRQ